MTNPTITVYVKGNAQTFTSAFANTREAADFLRGQRPTEFSTSLIENFDRNGAAISPKQAAWIHRLATDAKNPRPAAPTFDIDNLIRVVGLLDEAVENGKKFPKLRFKAGDQNVVLGRAGDRSSRPGTVNVTDGGPFGDNIWFGRIELDGAFTASRKMTQPVAELLSKIGVDPAKFAAEHGKELGICCFCSSDLTDEVSAKLGYGPTCAKKHGLPYGKKAVKTDITYEEQDAQAEHLAETDQTTSDLPW